MHPNVFLIRYIAFETIVTREVRRFSRIWLQTLVPPAITIGLYFVIFGNLVGRRIGEMGGFQYMEFIIPGLIMMSVIQNSYSNVVSSFFSQKFGENCRRNACGSNTQLYYLIWFDSRWNV